MITAPYNFVPLSDEVYHPDWANDISHDIPFNDGICGVIDVTIIAETPMFVRNGHTKEEGEAPASRKTENYKSFSINPIGKKFIPATSIKGEVRNILEILSFSKMTFVGDKRYSIRDLSSSNNKYMNFFKREIHCAWMRIDGNNLIIEDHGIPARLSLLDFFFKTNKNLVEKISDSDFLRKDINRTARCKYNLAGNAPLTGRFICKPFNEDNKVDNRVRALYNDKGEPGKIVFTGQPSARKEIFDKKKGKNVWTGKFYEFVFFDKVMNTYTVKDYESDSLYNDFCFIYKDSEDWKYWKTKLESGQDVPIFIATEKDALLNFGLSYLYKLPFPKKTNEYLPDSHRSSEADLAECIFGSLNHNIKGRVQFSHAYCTKEVECEEISPYLSSPKPTFYPAYLKQHGTKGYMSDDKGIVPFKTMLDEDAQLKGWKRYPARKQTISYCPPEGQEENTNPSYPLGSGSTFKLKIRFHNLRRIELGALLYALELKDGCSHSIGFAKSLGFGSCHFDVSAQGIDVEDVKECFVNKMKAEIKNYEKSPQLRELFAMTRSGNSERLSSSLEYMPEPKMFADCKKQNAKKEIYGEYLQPYSQLVKHEEKNKAAQDLIAMAVIKVDKGQRQAKLIEGNDNRNLPLEVPTTFKGKIKLGDKIEVKVVFNAKGKINSLLLIKKL